MIKKENLSYNPETGEMFYNRKAGLVPCSPNTGSNGYLRACFRGRRVEQHRLAMYLFHGVWPNQTDHINHDRSDNRISNLRDTDHVGNGLNRSDPEAGLSFCNTRSKWRLTRQQKHLGYFKTKEEALSWRRSCAD